MACGLKNQNNPQQGGVHLTERTCSPYNPIIKLMVDDCLGVPIYLVSSIDAIIDEEGRTLRQLLEDIQTGTSDGTLNLQETIEQIQNTLTTLNTIYATDSELTIAKGELEESISTVSSNLETLKKYLLAVYNLAQYGTSTNYEHETYNDVSYPKIVATIKLLLYDVNALLKGEYPDADLVDNLKNLLLAIANFDESSTFTRDQWIALGILPTEDGKLKIIYKILDLINDLGELGDNVTNLFTIVNGNTTDTNSLEYKNSVLGQLKYVIEQINLLWDWTKDNDFAHLETYADGNTYVKKLAVDEYPVTSAYFATDFSLLLNILEKIYISNLETFYLYIPAGVPIYVDRYKAEWDYNQNGKVDVGDVAILAQHINEKILTLPTGTDGDVNDDGEITIADVNDLINYILNPNSGRPIILSNPEWAKYIFEIKRRQTSHNAGGSEAEAYNRSFSEFLQGELGLFTVISHPLIPGKIYVDTNTSQPYRYLLVYETPSMEKVMDLEQLGVPQNNPEMLYLPINPNSPENSELNVTNPTGVTLSNDKYYTVSISEQYCPINITAYPWPENSEEVTSDKYYIKTDTSSILAVGRYDAANLNFEIADGVITYYPEILAVTDTIDYLLASNNKNRETILNSLKEIVDKNIKETPSSNTEALTVLELVLAHLNGIDPNPAPENILKLLSDSEVFVYYYNNGQIEHKSVGDYGTTVDLALPIIFNTNFQKGPNIEDVTDLIDVLLSGKGITYKDTGALPTLWKGNQRVMSLNSDSSSAFKIKTENRLVRLIDSANTEEWWQFKGNFLAPVNPTIVLTKNKDTGDIELYVNSSLLGQISLKDEPSSEPQNGGPGTLGMTGLTDEEVEPFIFGTWTGTDADLHDYLDEDGFIKQGTMFILTKLEAEGGSAPTLEDEYSYISDTDHYSMLTTPLYSPLVMQCKKFIKQFLSGVGNTVHDKLTASGFIVNENNTLIYEKVIRFNLRVFDFRYDTGEFVGNTHILTNPCIYQVHKLFHFTFKMADYMSAQLLALQMQSDEIVDPIDFMDYDVSLVFVNRINVIDNKEYVFPKYGITLKFKLVDRQKLCPMIKNNEYLNFENTIDASEYYPTPKPNNFLYIEVHNGDIIDFRPFFEIPGHEALTLSGILAPLDDNPTLTYLGTSNGQAVVEDSNSPTLSTHTDYKYILDGTTLKMQTERSY